MVRVTNEAEIKYSLKLFGQLSFGALAFGKLLEHLVGLGIALHRCVLTVSDRRTLPGHRGSDHLRVVRLLQRQHRLPLG
jgi:hypothetical protein